MSTDPAGIMDPDTTWVISEHLTLQAFRIGDPSVPRVIKRLVLEAIEAGIVLGNAITINLGSQIHPKTKKKLKKY